MGIYSLDSISIRKESHMKKIIFLPVVLGLAACQTPVAQQYVANMYAKGTLKGYENTGVANEANTNCPGCHVKNYDRVKLTVNEILSKAGIEYFVEGCRVSVVDSLGLINVSAERYIPATDNSSCITIFEKEKSYLKSMGFAE